MVDRFQMVTTHSEQVLNRPMDDKKALSLTDRSEASHLLLLLPRRLMRSLNSVVLVLTCAVDHGWEDLTMCGRIAAEFVGNQLPRWLPRPIRKLGRVVTDGGSSTCKRVQWPHEGRHLPASSATLDPLRLGEPPPTGCYRLLGRRESCPEGAGEGP